MIQLKTHQSAPSPVNSGVPQDFVPGPFLLILNLLRHGSVFRKHGLNVHCDVYIQLYPSTPDQLPHFSPLPCFHCWNRLNTIFNYLSSTARPYQSRQSLLLNLMTVMLFYMFSQKKSFAIWNLSRAMLPETGISFVIIVKCSIIIIICVSTCVYSSAAQGNPGDNGIKDEATDDRDHWQQVENKGRVWGSVL